MAENSWHRYDMKKLRHCHPMYKKSESILCIDERQEQTGPHGVVERSRRNDID